MTTEQIYTVVNGAAAQALGTGAIAAVDTASFVSLGYIKSIFNSYGSVGQQMTGSGSAVFAIVQDFEFAAVICDMLKANYPNVFIAKPV